MTVYSDHNYKKIKSYNKEIDPVGFRVKAMLNYMDGKVVTRSELYNKFGFASSEFESAWKRLLASPNVQTRTITWKKRQTTLVTNLSSNPAQTSIGREPQ